MGTSKILDKGIYYRIHQFKQNHGKKMLISKIKKEERAMSMLKKSMTTIKKRVELIETTIQHKKRLAHLKICYTTEK